MPYPRILRSPQAELARSRIQEFMQSDESVWRQRRAPIDEKIVLDPELNSILVESFNRACAYCETPQENISALDVAHHRPAGFASDRSGRTDPLHYVWLAYDWGNLYPVCGNCRHRKENYFPVAGSRGWIGASLDKLRKSEGALLLDPCVHDPSEHLDFHLDGHVEGLTPVGRMSVEILDLNRGDLIRQRRQAYRSAGDLLSAGTELAVEATGIEGRGSHVLAGSPTTARLVYPGSTSLVLLKLAAAQNLPAGSLPELGRFLREDSASASSMSGGIEEASEPAAELAGASAPSRSPPAGSRNFRVAAEPRARAPIRAIEIANFKALKSARFELPLEVEDPKLVPCMMLLGENAAGKSSALEAVALALLGSAEVSALGRLLVGEEVSPRDAAHRLPRSDWLAVGGQEVKMTIRFHGTDEIAEIHGRSDSEAFEGESPTTKVLLAYGPRRYFVPRSARRFRAPAFRVRSLFDPMATITNPSEWLLRCSDETFGAAARAMREILMLDEEVDFARKDGQIRIVSPKGWLPLSEMSVGYKSVVALATDIMRELMHHYDNLEHAAAVVLIDEIETHLHPRWKMRITGALRRAFPRVQFIITTHDPLCLRGMFAGEIFVLRRNTQSNEIEQLDDLPDIRGMRAEQILTSELFGLGSTDPETDSKLMRYQNLVTQGVDNDEVRTLRRDIETTMKIGDTVQDQLVAEAMREANIDPFAPLGPVKDKSRKEMVRSLVGKIKELRTLPRETAP